MHYFFLSYIHFLWQSKNEHAVHSPFVFNLVTQCFYDKKKYPFYKIFNNYRQQLYKNNNIIEITDFGAGSKIFKDNKRSVRQMAENAGISKKRAQLLWRMVQYFKPKNTLELGSSLGLSTLALSENNCHKITTVEGCKATYKHFCNYFFQKDKPHVEAIQQEFAAFLEQNNTKKYDFIYFDGNHSKDATLKYVDLLLPYKSNDSVWIFDDIYWSKDMTEAWKSIQKHPEVQVTIDTFQWGIVFFRKEQAKEHFIIRI